MEEESIGVIRLCSWADCPLPDLAQFTDASLSPSLHRLLLVSHQSGNAKLLSLSAKLSSAADPACQPGDADERLSSFAWACQQDSYSESGVCGPFEELLFTSGSRALTIYGFAKRAVERSGGSSSNWLHHLPAFEVEAELVVASHGRLLLHFPESECWPQVVAYKIPHGSPSFQRLLAFADPEAGAGASWSLVKLFSNTLATVGMLLAQQCKPYAQVVLLLTACGWQLCWHARVPLDMEHRWVDVTFLGDMLLGLTDTRLLCYWSASTGRRLRVVDLSLGCGLGDPAIALFAAGCSTVGITGKLGQLLLLPIDPDHVSHWDAAASQVWRHNWSATSLSGPSAFTPKRLLTGPKTGRAPQLRKLLLPSFGSSSCSVRLAAAAVSSHAVTRLFKVAEKTVVVQSRLRMASSPADAEFYAKDVEAVLSEQVLGLSCQGFLYLVTESALHVVLPQVSATSERPWWLTTDAPARWLDIWGMDASQSLRQSKLEVLDRALIYDGLEEAEQLSALNGWSVKFTRLRKLQLSLAYGRTDEIAQILNELVPVGAGEEGLPRVVFAAMELMLNKFGTDNELAQATRLLAVAARFTKQLMIGRGLVRCLTRLACFLEAIRSLQAHLHVRHNRPKSEKSEVEASDKTEKRKQNSKFIGLEDSRDSNVSSANTTSLALAEAATGEITPWKEPSLETAREMLLRWDKEDVDLFGIVKDALRAGRVPLAVVQLHQRRGRDGPSESIDVFKEVRNAGKSIVYELLCKGKVPVALAALRRLGEDIPVVLYDLAFGTVRRSLRICATRELRRYGQLDAASLRLMQIISKIENVYPGTKFWRSYYTKLTATGRKENVEEPLQLSCSNSQEAFTVSCGEVDGVVLGSWNEIPGSEMEEESADAQACPSYWVGAAIWLQDWNQETTDRVILEQSSAVSDISWKSQLAYNLAHHASQSVLELFKSIPEPELQRSDLEVSLDSTPLEEGPWAQAVDAVVVAVPDLKLLKTGLEACTSWLREAIESGLARRRIFLKAEWTGSMQLLSLLAKAGLVFSSPENGMGNTYALHQIVVHHCVENNFPCLLELYLGHHKTDFHKMDAIRLRSVVEDSPWATWLLLSHRRDCEYETAFANARAILSSSEFAFSSLTDLAKHGNEFLAISILMYAPALPQRCIITGFNQQPRESWHCAIEYLQGLRRYPTLWTTIKSFCYGKALGNRVESALPSYLMWRKSLFSSSNGDATLLDMLPKWLPRAIRRLIRLSAEESGDESFVDPVSWEATLNTKLHVQLLSGTSEDTSTIIERQLLQGRPLAAFSHLIAAREELGISKETEKRIVDAVAPLALANFGDMVVTAACTCFMELCSVPTTVMRTDVAALLRISERPSTKDLCRYFSELLCEDYGRPGSPTAALVLEHLEKATLEGNREGCGTWLRNGAGDGQQLRTSHLWMSERWSLVTAFCRLHHLPPSTTYLSLLAADNDWVGFLAEAQAESCPIEVLLSIAREHFTDDRLRNHILIVLESLSSGQSTAADLFGDRGTPNDLFDILAKTEHQKSPGKELLERARILRWPLLAVAAACFSDVTPVSCLSTWLEVTAASEASCLSFNNGASQFVASVGGAVDAANATTHMGNTLPSYVRCGAKRRRIFDVSEDVLVAPAAVAKEDAQVEQNRGLATETQSGKARDDHESLARMVAALCEHQRFLPLLRAFELFLPSSPLVHVIRFLRAFSQMRLPEASAHLADFSSSLREEIHSKGKASTSWISKAAVAGADAVLGACPSAYEKRCMLQLLAAAEFGDGGSAAVRFRRMYWKIQLAEPSLHQDGLCLTDGSDLGDEALLAALEKSGQWEEARSWARQLDFGQQSGSRAVDHVTEMQAEAMVAEWKELLWDMPEQRAALWRHCQALFTKHAYPPLKAGLFLMRHAEDIEQNGSPSELHGILLLALQWLSGSITGSPPVYPVPFLRELETRVWLLAVESEVLMQTKQGGSNHPGLNIESCLSLLGSSGSPVDRTAAKIAVVDSHLKAYSSNELRQVSNSEKEPVPKLKRRLLKRLAYREQQATESSVVEKRSNDEEPTGWEEKVGDGEVERAILALVEVGQVQAARQLQQKLAPVRVPLELTLCETALGVAMLSTPTVKGCVGSSLVPPGVLKTLNSLNLLKDVSSASPLQVMEALTAACREGCGRGHCRRITAVAQVANFLGLPFHEAFQKQATELLQLLSLKGQDALAEAKLLVATHSINPASIARLLAESFLKGLLAAHRGGYMESSAKEEGPAPLLWRPSDFVQWGKLCPSEPELGHALMRLVIGGHDMPHACEVELLILAHQFYESSACLDGMDVLVALAATRVESYLAEADFPALARLVTGVSNFQALRFVLDLLIENGQLELLLKKRATVDASSGKESSASLRGFRMAVLSALKHFNPHDVDAFGMVFSHFSMAHEMANLLESRGRKGLSHWYLVGEQAEQNEETLDTMRLFVEASEVYAGIDCGNRTRWCCAQASLLSLQLRMPEVAWLNLGETGARRLLVEQRRFGEALVVAEAYELNQPAEWVPVLWSQVLSPPHWTDHFLAEFTASLPLSPTTLMELARIYRSEQSARTGFAASDFSKWLAGAPEIARSFRCVLRRVRDLRLRMQLATLASGFPDVLDSCARVLDKVPDTAGPLVLKRGHGGTYVPVM